ncbi:MAG: lysylphosphatidylglycerol synthase transmembrane domain-containing protein [Bacteroidales bacterium]|nr:lysylphosphatidylglycerol synthase transmembrane domain-containing protein [Bacteroidales bacterium]
METKTIIRKATNILLPFAIGGVIIWWMYRGFDFSKVSQTLRDGMDWNWMLISLIFGITAQVFRGLRWKQTLEPLDEHPRMVDCIHAIFISYASSLVIPRSGEVIRCGILKKYDGTSFSKSLGTVLTERVIDSILILLICLIVFLLQLQTFTNFFAETGTNFVSWLNTFTTTGWIVTICCLILTIIFVYILLKRVTGESKIKQIISDLKAGIFSLKDVDNKGLFTFYTLAIWVSYFLHFYIAFFSFEYTANLSLMTALVAFIIGSIAVVVPTPNGMGPWHFAVKTILVLYGVAATDAEMFVMIVWAVQTALMPVLGVYSLLCLARKKEMNK